MSNTIPVIKFCFKNEWKPLEQALGMSQAYDSLDCDDPQKIISFLNDDGDALVVCSLSTKEDLVQIATLAKLSKKAKDCVLKIVVVNFSKSKQFDIAVNKLGIQEILDIAVPPKSLRFKLDLWIKALKAQSKKAGAELAVKTSEPKAQSQDKKSEEKNVVALPSLNCPDDIWLQHRDFECKKVLGRWLMRLMGPGPYVAQWTEVLGKKNLWRFEFTASNKDNFLKGKGEWYFRGDYKPEFNWKENLWYMMGDAADLFYYETEVQSRLQLKDKVLSIAANSPFARSKEKFILESFDKELVFKNDQKNEESDSLTDNSTELDSMMKGLGMPSDKLKSGLQGKGKTDHLENKNLQGDNLAEMDLGDPLKGQLSGEKQETKEHERRNPFANPTKKTQESKESSFEQEKQSGHLKGKSSTSHLNHSGKEAPVSGPSMESSELGYEQKHHKHETKYKGHFEPEEFEAIEKEHAAQKEKEKQKSAGSPAGKGSTTHVDHSGHKSPFAKTAEAMELEQESKNHTHETKYKGHFEPEEFAALEKEAKNNREGEKKKSSGPLSGKGLLTDVEPDNFSGPASRPVKKGALLDLENKNHTHETKYKGHHEAEKFEAKEGRKNQYHEEDQGEEYGGKSHTDHLRKHYGGQEQEESQASDDESSQESGLAPLKGKIQQSTAKRKEKEQHDSEEDSNVVNFATAKNRDTQKKSSTKSKASFDSQGPVDQNLEEASQGASVAAYIVHDKIRLACDLDDFFENQAIFRLAQCHLKDQDKVDLDISFDYLKQVTQLKVSGVILSHDVSEETSFVTVELGPVAVNEFEAFMKLYQKRQQNVEYFMNKVKGL